MTETETRKIPQGWRHVGISIKFAERFPNQMGFTDGKTGKPVSAERVQAYLDDLKAHGYEAIPCCDNVDAKGWCLGSDKMTEQDEKDLRDYINEGDKVLSSLLAGGRQLEQSLNLLEGKED